MAQIMKADGILSARTVAAVLVLGVFSSAVSADHSEAHREGEVHITGSLHEAPCTLEMSSQHQRVDLGAMPSSVLTHPGDRGQAIAFELRLKGCVRRAGRLADARTGHFTWSANQPLMSVAFVALANVENSQLVKVQGIDGMGLRLTDAQHQPVRLGELGPPLFLSPGANVLTWYVQPERTAASLTPGPFWATVDFRLAYD